MKKLFIFVFCLTLLTSCEQRVDHKSFFTKLKEQREERKNKKEAEKAAEWVPMQEAPQIDEKRTVHVTYEIEKTDSSYWYVILDEKMKNGQTTTWHGTVSLGTPYFDFYEAKNQFDAKGKCFFKFIVQISKESVQTFEDYSEIQ